VLDIFMMKLGEVFQSIREPSQERSISNLLSRLVASLMIPLLAFSALLLMRFTEAQQERAEQTIAMAAAGLAKDTDREIRGIIAALSGLSSSPALRSGDFATFYDQVSQVAKLIKSPILLQDPKFGQQLLNTRRPYGAPLPDADPSLTIQQVLATKAPYVSDLIFGTVAQRNLIAVAIPVILDGEVRFVLTASVEPERLVEVMSDQPLPDSWTTELSDRKGRIIARSRDLVSQIGQPILPLEETAGDSGVQRVRDRDDTLLLRAFRRTDHGWLVAAILPMHVVEGPLRESWLAFLTVGAVMLMLALPLTISFARRIAESIRNVAEAAAALERGEVVPPVKTHVQEASEVATILSTASHSLRERTRLLAESAARFRSAFDQAAVGFEQMGLDGRWVMLNNRFCQMLGYTREECMELSSEVLTHPEDHLVEAPLLARLARGDIPGILIEKRYFKKGGGVVWVRSTTSLVRDLEGAALYYVSIVEDITTGQMARAVTARMAALVQVSNDAILSITPGLLIDTWNPGAERLFGYAEAEILGQRASTLGFAAMEKQLQAFFDRGFEGESFRVETNMRRKDGQLVDVELSVSPIIAKTDQVMALSVTIKDIRERRLWQKQLLLLNRELQHRVKNSLAVVQSIANQTGRSSTTLDGFRTAFQGRLQALAAANDLLLQSAWTGSDLETVINQQMKPLLSESAIQMKKRGVKVALPAELTVPVGLALHELGTNALKYGSLSAATGRIDIAWTIEPRDEHHELVLTWREFGGPAAVQTERRGFGSTLIMRGIPGAIVERRFEPEGLVCKITLTLENRPLEQLAIEGTV
jgi:PAS domain S-box-containing protein